MKLLASLKTKMIVTLVAVIVFLGALAAFAAMYMTEGAVSRIALKHTRMVVAQQEAIISRVMTDATSFARHVGSQQLLIDYLQQADPQEQDPALLAYISNFTTSAQYQAIYIMDDTGETLVSTDPTFVGQNYAFRTYFQEAIAGKPSVDAAIGVTSKKFGYYFSYPIKNASGKILGVLSTKLKEELVANALKPGSLSSEGAAMLVDRYGVVIQSTQPNMLFKSMGELTPEVRRTLMETKRFSDFNITSLHYDQVAEGLSDLQGAEGFISDDGFREYAELVGAMRITGTPFFVVIVEARHFFTQPAGNMALNSGLLVMTLAIGSIIILIVVLVRLLKPVSALKKLSLQISNGGMVQPIMIETGDEFEDIGKAFNVLMDRVTTACVTTKGALWNRAADFEKFKLAVDSASDHIIITDNDGRILYANKAVESITGYSRNEILGNRASLWGRQMPAEFYRDMWATIKDQKRVFHAEMTNKKKDGERYVAEVHITPILDDKGELQGFVGIERNITAQKDADRAKTEFVSIASHQLRTPLAAINWYVEMLSNEDIGQINEAQRKYLDQIHSASAHMVDLVGSLLSVARIDTGSFNLMPVPVLLTDVADSVIDELGHLAGKKQITIVRKYGPQMEPINVDSNMIRVVFQNLFSNAIKYTPKKGSITISITQDTKRALITVADTGYGIPPAQQAMVFTKFFRADNAREKEPDGNGLGLYISKSIIEHAQGTIEFSSEENKGSIFRVSIPITDIKIKAEKERASA